MESKKAKTNSDIRIVLHFHFYRVLLDTKHTIAYIILIIGNIHVAFFAPFCPPTVPHDEVSDVIGVGDAILPNADDQHGVVRRARPLAARIQYVFFIVSEQDAGRVDISYDN